MKLSDLNIMQKMIGSFKILKQYIQFYRINFIRFPAPQQNLSKRMIYPLYKFNDPKTLLQWKLYTDQRYGGQSSAELILNKDFLQLKGKISQVDKEKLLMPPSVGMEMYFPQVRFKYFNILQLKVKTDKKLYKVMLRLKIALGYQFYVYGVIVDQSNEWQILQLPFGLFEQHRQIAENQFKSIKGYPVRINCMQIVTYSMEQQQVQFNIGEINLVYEPHVEQFYRKYRRPIFYKPILDYKNPTVIDNGREILYIKKK